MPKSEFVRTCSECGKSLKGYAPQAKTCGDTCRTKRSRRMRAQNKAAAEKRSMPEHQRALSEVVHKEAPDIAHKVIQEELRPVVREAITEDVLRSIQQLVGLTPEAVAALQLDLQSEFASVRQKAYTLILKYTIGHPAIVKPEDEGSQGLTVYFNLPRPSGETQEDNTDVTPMVEAVEYRSCHVCGTERPVDEFVAGSDRCVDCHEKFRERAREMIGGNDSL